MGFPELKVDLRDREFNLYSNDKREMLVVRYLFEKVSTRDLDCEVLELNPDDTDGWQSNSILHHYGIYEPHKEIFKGMGCWEAIDAIPNTTEEYKLIRDIVARHADYVDHPPVKVPRGGKGFFFDYLSDLGLDYPEDIVVDFLLSLKAKQFVILSGGTGTGKTRLAKAYGEYISNLTCKMVKRYEIVPVGSNWTDNRNIVGYRNAISGKYSMTSSLKLMLDSNNDPSHGYMLILDEMNLSHVERYFSDVISCMESGEPIHIDMGDDIPKDITIGDNLFIVGTVNMDETTFTLSPKVLDRANVLEFEPLSVSDYLKKASSYDISEKKAKFLQNPKEGLECRRLNARAVINEMFDGDLDNPITNDLDSIQEILSEMGLPFGHRTLDEVMRFMYVAWKYEGDTEFVSWGRYMDAQIHQKILPKIHGNISILDDLKKLRQFCKDGNDEGDGSIGKGESVEDFRYKRSWKKLDCMVKILEHQRYVTFNC